MFPPRFRLLALALASAPRTLSESSLQIRLWWGSRLLTNTVPAPAAAAHSTKRIKVEFSSDGTDWRDSDAVETTLRDRRGGVAKVKAIQQELVKEQNKDDADDDVIEDKEAELELAKLNLGTRSICTTHHHSTTQPPSRPLPWLRS